MKRNRILCVTLIGLLLMMAAGCQKTPGVLPGDSSVIASLQENISPAVSLDTSSESEMSTSVAAPASSQTSHLQTSSVTVNENSSQAQSASSELASSYIYSDKVAEKVDPANFSDTITIVLTPEASKVEKTYNELDFPGCDITVTEQGHYGGNSTEYNIQDSQREDNFLYVYLHLKINKAGFENYEKVVQYFDQREDVLEIWLKPHVIPD